MNSHSHTSKQIAITTFGYLHGDPPAGVHIVLDLRVHFRDPHVNPALRYMTVHDAEVREAVLSTSGILTVIESAVLAVRAFLSGPSAAAVSIAVGCAGGRHRAATVGAEIAAAVREQGLGSVTLVHRDLDKDVVKR
jgi:RNase adaptor protein for sRNA GlmZ degradation